MKIKSSKVYIHKFYVYLIFIASYLANKFITNTGLLLMLGGEDAFNKIESSS